MPRKINLTLVFNLLTLFLTGQIVAKIDMKLQIADITKKQNIVVILKDQTNVSDLKKVNIPDVKNIKGKDAKAAFMYESLTKKADQSQHEIATFLQQKDIPFQSYYLVNMITLQADWDMITAIASLNSVGSVIEDGNLVTQTPVTDRKEYGTRAIEWNVSHINAPAVWNLGYTGQGVVIGGQDTGYEWNDPVLINKYRGWNGTAANHNYNWHDAIDSTHAFNSGINPCGYQLTIPCDDNNHGTHTMGTMVGDDGLGNQTGVAPGAKWIGCRNMERGWGTLSSYVECFQWFLAPYPVAGGAGDPSKMPHVINNSWGCPPIEGCNTTNFAVMETALNNLRNAGCVIVVSAGNSGPSCSTVNDPAAIFSGSFSVGATNSADAIAGFSSRGPVTVDGSNRLKPDISAPGVSIRSCIKGTNAFASYNGTSMAGPHVAGLVALLISANPELAGEVEKIEDIIEQTAVPKTTTENCGSIPGTTIPNNTFGYGRIDALAAVKMALPSIYPPYVKQQNSIIIKNPNNGLVLVSQNENKYRIQISNAGQLTKTLITSLAPTSVITKNGSFNLENSSAKIILRSPDNNYWQLDINNDGVLSAVKIFTLPPLYTEVTTGDVCISDGLKGVLLRSPDNTCFLTNISNSGKIMTIPAICLN
jgi:serine protease AprX